MHSSPFSKKHQARLLGKNQREKYPFTFKLISALDSNSREKKSDSTRRYYRRRVVRESSPRVRGFETNASSLLKHSSQRVVVVYTLSF